MRYRLISDTVGDYDGAYDVIDPTEYDLPENSIGYHKGSWPDWGYTIIEPGGERIAELEAEVKELQGEFEIVRDLLTNTTLENERLREELALAE